MCRASLLVLAVGAIVVGGAPAEAQEPPPKKDAPEEKKFDPSTAAAQSYRWTLRFRTKSGKDYVEQLAAVGCSVLVPMPPDNKRVIYIPDLHKLDGARPGTDDDIKALSAQVRFSDRDEESVKSVAEALGLDFTPKMFYAFFSKEVREELTRLEKEYGKGIDVKDVQETVFNVAIKDGKATFTVVE